MLGVLRPHRSPQGEGGRISVPAYLCATCGAPTLTCAAPQCDNMATRGSGSVRIPRFCAEHRHELPSFERASAKIDTVDDYEQLRVFDKSNLSRGSKYALAGVFAAGVVGTGGLMAAPAVGGAIGTPGRRLHRRCRHQLWAGLTRWRLGGCRRLGMVGGTYVVAAAGAALGGALGANITNAYVSEDKSFAHREVPGRTRTPVIVARGFTTEKDQNWKSAMQMVEARYPDSPIYRLRWGSKELSKLAALAVRNVGANQAMAAVGGAGGARRKVGREEARSDRTRTVGRRPRQESLAHGGGPRGPYRRRTRRDPGPYQG